MKFLQTIRTNARNNQPTIIGHLEHYYMMRENGRARARPARPICMFCAVEERITQEHVLPRWVFHKDPNRSFTTSINGLSHKYNQTTVSACATCNNDLLSAIEKRIHKLFLRHQKTGEFFNEEETEDIIRWMEILDYKYQVFSLVTKFKALKGNGPIGFLSDYSLSVLDPNVDYSPAKAMRNLRQAFHRLTVKSKEKNFYSLVTFKTKNPDFHSFHGNNNFIFLELPRYNLALFYFYKLVFADATKAKDAVMEILARHY